MSRLHVEVGHSDARGMIDPLRRKNAYRLIIATANNCSCSVYRESQRRRLHPVAARVLGELGTCLQVDQFEWKHPVLDVHVLGRLRSFRTDAKELFKSLIFSVVRLDDPVIDSWRKATRHDRIDFAEVCCTSDSLLTGTVTSHGGRVVQYSHWNGFDLIKKTRTET